MIGFLNFNFTMGKKQKKNKKKKEKNKKKKKQEKENLIYYNTLFISPNVLHIFTPICLLYTLFT